MCCQPWGRGVWLQLSTPYKRFCLKGLEACSEVANRVLRILQSSIRSQPFRMASVSQQKPCRATFPESACTSMLVHDLKTSI